MDCDHSQQNILFELTNPEVQEHLRQCKACNDLDDSINNAMLLLEEPIEVPEKLLARILLSRSEQFAGKKSTRNFSLLVQVSTVMAAAILLGIILGSHANTQLLFSKNFKKTEALNEFKEMHHLNVDRQRLF